jgi:KDO2-lipid IV(A) lauroyltransferase
MIKTLTISQSGKINKRYTFTILNLFRFREKYQVIVKAIAECKQNNNLHCHGIYKIANEHFDKLVKYIRSKFKAVLINERNETNEHNAAIVAFMVS